MKIFSSKQDNVYISEGYGLRPEWNVTYFLIYSYALMFHSSHLLPIHA